MKALQEHEKQTRKCEDGEVNSSRSPSSAMCRKWRLTNVCFRAMKIF